MRFAAFGRCALGLHIITINSLLQAACCALRRTSHSHGSPWVFLTGYKWRQTHPGRNCTRSYPIPRRILKILEELSTFTFRQPTRWVGLTNSKITSLCQSTIPHSTKVDLFYSVREINIPNIVWDSCAIDPKLIQPLASPKNVYAMWLTQQIRTFSLKCWKTIRLFLHILSAAMRTW